MSRAPLMPMYWDAYLADTTHLTTEEHGAYMLLLAAMWRRNGWVPDDDKDLARIVGLTPTKWRKAKARIAAFLTFENGQITQKNLQKIWKNTQEKIEKNRSNGARGGRPSSSKNNNLAKANGSVSRKPNKTIPEPEPELHKEDTNVSLSDRPISDDVSEAIAAYNAAAKKTGWPAVQTVSDARKRMLKVRLTEAGGIEGWRIAVEKAAQSDFLTGRTSNPWMGFGFDWLIKAANFTKIMEGNYDNRTGSGPAGGGSTSRRSGDRIFEQIAEIARSRAASGAGGS